MKTGKEIQDAVQELVDESFQDCDFPVYIFSCDELTDEEKEWASENLGVRAKVEILTRDP